MSILCGYEKWSRAILRNWNLFINCLHCNTWFHDVANARVCLRFIYLGSSPSWKRSHWLRHSEVPSRYWRVHLDRRRTAQFRRRLTHNPPSHQPWAELLWSHCSRLELRRTAQSFRSSERKFIHKKRETWSLSLITHHSLGIYVSTLFQQLQDTCCMSASGSQYQRCCVVLWEKEIN